MIASLEALFQEAQEEGRQSAFSVWGGLREGNERT